MGRSPSINENMERMNPITVPQWIIVMVQIHEIDAGVRADDADGLRLDALPSSYEEATHRRQETRRAAHGCLPKV
jgi:hypothetical protein